MKHKIIFNLLCLTSFLAAQQLIQSFDSSVEDDAVIMITEEGIIPNDELFDNHDDKIEGTGSLEAD